jgi:hypothetical protein
VWLGIASFFVCIGLVALGVLLTVLPRRGG